MELYLHFSVHLHDLAVKHSDNYTVTTFLRYWLLAFRGTVWVILLMKQQFAITHTICQTMIPTLLNSWVTNAPSIKMSCPPKKNCLSLYFCKILTCLRVGLLRIYQVFFCLLYNCVLVGYERLLFLERYVCDRFEWAGMSPHGRWVSFPYNPAIVQITLSSVKHCVSLIKVDCFHAPWNETLLQ